MAFTSLEFMKASENVSLFLERSFLYTAKYSIAEENDGCVGFLDNVLISKGLSPHHLNPEDLHLEYRVVSLLGLTLSHASGTKAVKSLKTLRAVSEAWHVVR